jgi:DNA repair exonuclease SbcCD ATPase subunit
VGDRREALHGALGEVEKLEQELQEVRQSDSTLKSLLQRREEIHGELSAPRLASDESRGLEEELAGVEARIEEAEAALKTRASRIEEKLAALRQEVLRLRHALEEREEVLRDRLVRIDRLSRELHDLRETGPGLDRPNATGRSLSTSCASCWATPGGPRPWTRS